MKGPQPLGQVEREGELSRLRICGIYVNSFIVEEGILVKTSP